MTITPEEILDFWFTEPMCSHWFRSTAKIDQDIGERYEKLWELAARGELDDWQESANGCLALAIVLDQFPLNMFRGQAKSFATEDKAIQVSLRAVDRGFDNLIDKDRLAFLYMPLMHSESLQHQDMSVALFTAAGLKDNLRFALHHRQLIQEFGRFPHRNAILGRASTEQEQEYLASERAFKG